jgi:hypothetical protein
MFYICLRRHAGSPRDRLNSVFEHALLVFHLSAQLVAADIAELLYFECV